MAKERDVLGLDTLDYMPEVEAAIRRRGSRFAYLLSVFIIIFVAGAVSWANWAVLDEVTRGEGQVIPSSRTQVIQNLEGGILSDILVRENQIVEKGDILVRIDNVQAASDFEDKKQQYLATKIAIARAQAEIDGDQEVNFPADLIKLAPQIVTDQRRYFDTRKEQLRANISVLNLQRDQRKQEIGELRSRRGQLSNSLKLAREQRDIAKKLAKRGVYPRVEFIKLEREVKDLEGEIRT